MPTNRTKRGRHTAGWNYWQLEQLVTGSFSLVGGYASLVEHGGCNHWSDEEWAFVYDTIRKDWERDGAAFMAWWRGETETYTAVYASIGGRRRDPTVIPWALTEFGAP